MIYSKETLAKLKTEVIKEHETNLVKELESDIQYWHQHPKDTVDWAYKVSVDVTCLNNVRLELKNDYGIRIKINNSGWRNKRTPSKKTFLFISG